MVRFLLQRFLNHSHYLSVSCVRVRFNGVDFAHARCFSNASIYYLSAVARAWLFQSLAKQCPSIPSQSRRGCGRQHCRLFARLHGPLDREPASTQEASTRMSKFRRSDVIVLRLRCSFQTKGGAGRNCKVHELHPPPSSCTYIPSSTPARSFESSYQRDFQANRQAVRPPPRPTSSTRRHNPQPRQVFLIQRMFCKQVCAMSLISTRAASVAHTCIAYRRLLN